MERSQATWYVVLHILQYVCTTLYYYAFNDTVVNFTVFFVVWNEARLHGWLYKISYRLLDCLHICNTVQIHIETKTHY